MAYFIDRCSELLDAMEKNGWKSPNGKTYPDPSFVIDRIERIGTNFREYTECVAEEPERIENLKKQYHPYDGQTYRNEVMRMDSLRRSRHDSCIVDLESLNRLCKTNGLRPFTEINTENPNPNERQALTDLIGRCSSELDGGRASTMAEAVKEIRSKQVTPRKDAVKGATERILAQAGIMAEQEGSSVSAYAYA